MRDLKFVALLLVGCLICLYFLTPHVSASDDDYSVDVPDAIHAPVGQPPSIEVRQGSPEAPEVIYWNETVDFSLVEGWYGIVVRHPGGELVDVSQFTHNIFVDPAVFPEGTWYQWSPEGISAHGNQIAFEVKPGPRPNPNETSVYNLTLNASVVTYVFHENLPLPDKHAADYLVAHGDSLNVTFSGWAQVWIFENKGTGDDWLYPRIGNNSILYPADDIETLRAGNYTMIIQNLSTNRVADVTYANFTRTRTDNGYDDVIYSPFGGENTTISAWQPFMIQDEVIRRLDNGMVVEQGGYRYNIFDDSYEMKTLWVGEPESEIVMIDEYVRSQDRNNASVVHVAGYTNVANETLLRIYLDKDKGDIEFPDIQKTTAVGKNVGDWRQFSVMYPVYYHMLEGGGKDHSFSVLTPSNATTSGNFRIYDIPEGQVKPLATLRYIGGNEFVPTPTPEKIVERVVVTVPPVVTYVTIEVIKEVEVAPWYLSPLWIVVWFAISISITLYLMWRFS